MKFLKKYNKFIIIMLCLITSTLLSYFFTYENNEIINTSTVVNILITLFSVLLAVDALMITILDKYKENTHDTNIWAKQSSSVLKSLSENTIFLLVLILIVIFSSLLDGLLDLVPCFNITNILLLSSLMLTLIVTFDTSISVHILIINLKDALSSNELSISELTTTEMHIIDAYRYFNDKYKQELTETIKTLSVRQELDNKSN